MALVSQPGPRNIQHIKAGAKRYQNHRKEISKQMKRNIKRGEKNYQNRRKQNHRRWIKHWWSNNHLRCTTPPFGISLGWTSIILGCIPKHRKKFGMDPKLRPSQTPTIHPSRFFWHIPHSEPNWKTCVYLKSSINQSGCGESESSFLCTL